MRQGSRLLMQVGHHAFCHNLSQADHFHSRIYHLRPFPCRILCCRWGSQFPLCIWIVHVPCADLPEYEAPRYIDRADTLPEANNGCLPCRSIKLTHHKDYIHIVAGADVRAAFDHVTSKSRTSGTVSCFWERSAAVMPHFRVWMWWVAFVLFSARKLSMFLIIPQGTQKFIPTSGYPFQSVNVMSCLCTLFGQKALHVFDYSSRYRFHHCAPGC